MRLVVSLASLAVLSTSATALAAPVTVAGDPVAPLPSAPGTGACAITRVSTNPANDFPQSAGTFVSGMEAFFGNDAGAWTTTTITRPFDLSNNQNAGLDANGDFVSAVPGCQAGGCDFAVNDSTTSFGMRVRAFFAVSAARANKPLHVGAMTDDAVSLTVWDASGAAYPVFVRPPQLGFASWRTTNTVTFPKPGLYPIEILYAQVADKAYLELSTYEGTFTDFERPSNQMPIVDLATAGFTLIPATDLYAATTAVADGGAPTCVPCTRLADAGTTGCSAGSYCNPAALCETCNTNAHCGTTCAPCGAGESCVAGQCAVAVADAGPDAATDAAAAPDAGSGAGTGPGSGTDAGTPTATGGTDDGGCGCHTAGRASGAGVALLFFLTALVARLRRR